MRLPRLRAGTLTFQRGQHFGVQAGNNTLRMFDTLVLATLLLQILLV
jgi:hypothetical protein